MDGHAVSNAKTRVCDHAQYAAPFGNVGDVTVALSEDPTGKVSLETGSSCSDICVIDGYAALMTCWGGHKPPVLHLTRRAYR